MNDALRVTGLAILVGFALVPARAAAFDLLGTDMKVKVGVVDGKIASLENASVDDSTGKLVTPVFAVAKCCDVPENKCDYRVEYIDFRVKASESSNLNYKSSEVFYIHKSFPTTVVGNYAWSEAVPFAVAQDVEALCAKPGPPTPGAVYRFAYRCVAKTWTTAKVSSLIKGDPLEKAIYQPLTYPLSCVKSPPPKPKPEPEPKPVARPTPVRGDEQPNVPVPEPECRTDPDCGRNRHCARGTCLDGVRPECTTAEDCGLGEICTRKQCIPGR